MNDENLDQLEKLTEKDTFQFTCEKGHSCFNKCCTDVNIFLTPYDVIRLKQHLNLESGDFLAKYTISPFTKDQKLPVLILKLLDDDKKTCPFVTKEGCSVYENRPWSCRMYPLGLASQKVRSEDVGNEYYFLQKDDFCEGVKMDKEWTVLKWMDDQSVKEYEEYSTLYREILLHKYFEKGQELGPDKMDMFHMVFYNIDKFREFIFSSTFLNRFEVSEEEIERYEKDDLELLKFGVQWLKLCLFSERTIPLRGEVPAEAPAP